MRIYTELNLGKTDPGLGEPDVPFDITTATEKAALVERLGFDGVVATETKDDSFMLMTLAASATTRLQLATSVAIAFARAPYTTALAARLSVLSREQRWEEMPDYIDDDVLGTYAVVGLYDEIGEKIVDRFGGVLSDVGFSIAVENDRDGEEMKRMIERVQAG